MKKKKQQKTLQNIFIYCIWNELYGAILAVIKIKIDHF